MKITKWLKKDYLEVGEGWRELVTKLAKDIIKIDPSIEVAQVKEKFGGLRFYIGGATDEIFDLIDKAEEESFKICEVCGSRDSVTLGKSYWVKSLCKACRKEEKC